MRGYDGALEALRPAIRRHRRLLAAGLAAGSVAFALTALAPAPPPTVAVVVAARDLPGGAPLAEGDLTFARVPPGAVPAGAVDASDVVGRVLAAPVRRGEPVTDVRVVGGGGAASYGPGRVGTPVRVADAAAVALLRPGDVVDVLAAESTGGDLAAGSGEVVALEVAEAVRVVAVPRPADDEGLLGAGAGEGALVVLATTPAQARALARAAVTARVSVVLRGG